MNALSALRSLAYPALQADPTGRVAGSAAPKIIPFTELEQLSPGILPLPAQPASSVQPIGDGPGSLLGGLVREVNAKSAASSQTVNALLSGGNVSLHQAMIAMEEASVSFHLMVEVRNRLLESYQELMRMQV
jgi:flagellar hook-basal body complex protein FliE